MAQDPLAGLSEEQITEAIQSTGAQEHHRSDKHIWYTTVCHGGDSHKLCYNRGTRTLYCYTHCGFMSVPDFLQKMGVPPSYLNAARRRGLGKSNLVVQRELQEVQRVAELLHRESGDFKFESLNTHVLECFESNVFYDGWLEEGISAETMQLFEIRWDEASKAIIIPHYDINGQLVGIRTRQIEANKAKYMPLIMGGEIFGHPLGMNLYGGHLHKQAIRRSKQAIVVEGEKSVMKHHTWFGLDSNVVAVCGFNITNAQRKLLVELGVEEVVLAFDKDVMMATCEEDLTPEYERYCEVLNRFGKQLAPYCRVTAIVDEDGLLGLKDAPVDQGKEVFVQLMKKRQQIVC